jgi:hypothetical protein
MEKAAYSLEHSVRSTITILVVFWLLLAVTAHFCKLYGLLRSR